VDTSGHFIPYADNAYTCGKSGARWSVIWAATGTISTSDARQKTEIEGSDLGLDFVKQLHPVSYRWVDGTRRHYGLIAQEVKASLGSKDFAGYIKSDLNDPESDEGLRYDQFIAVLVRAVQELSAQVDALQAGQ
jgi:hypothetical protein